VGWPARRRHDRARHGGRGDQRLPDNIREFIALSATLFVLVTLFVNATTLGLVMHALGLDKLSRLELALRDRVLALSRVNVEHHLQEIMRRRNARVEASPSTPPRPAMQKSNRCRPSWRSTSMSG